MPRPGLLPGAAKILASKGPTSFPPLLTSQCLLDYDTIKLPLSLLLPFSPPPPLLHNVSSLRAVTSQRRLVQIICRHSAVSSSVGSMVQALSSSRPVRKVQNTSRLTTNTHGSVKNLRWIRLLSRHRILLTGPSEASLS